jgi:hypothetical protein
LAHLVSACFLRLDHGPADVEFVNGVGVQHVLKGLSSPWKPGLSRRTQLALDSRQPRLCGTRSLAGGSEAAVNHLILKNRKQVRLREVHWPALRSPLARNAMDSLLCKERQRPTSRYVDRVRSEGVTKHPSCDTRLRSRNWLARKPAGAAIFASRTARNGKHLSGLSDPGQSGAVSVFLASRSLNPSCDYNSYTLSTSSP